MSGLQIVPAVKSVLRAFAFGAFHNILKSIQGGFTPYLELTVDQNLQNFMKTNRIISVDLSAIRTFNLSDESPPRSFYFFLKQLSIYVTPSCIWRWYCTLHNFSFHPCIFPDLSLQVFHLCYLSYPASVKVPFVACLYSTCPPPHPRANCVILSSSWYALAAISILWNPNEKTFVPDLGLFLSVCMCKTKCVKIPVAVYKHFCHFVILP